MDIIKKYKDKIAYRYIPIASDAIGMKTIESDYCYCSIKHDFYFWSKQTKYPWFWTNATITFVISGNETFRGSQKAFVIGDKNPYCFFLNNGQIIQAENIRNECLKRIEKTKNNSNVSNVSIDITDQLEKLSKHRENGVIHEEEFINKKEKLLYNL